MKTLIVEDDFTSRLLLQEILKAFGAVHIAVNGREALEAVNTAMENGQPYDLICLDIMLPEMDGYEALRKIRGAEEERGITSSHGAKIIMTTALDHVKNVIQAFHGLCDAYLVKPIDKAKMLEQLGALGLA
ncbi:MAG TPA: response regulator [Bryobacteraceae bacterium]|nr:response regulator [Bryobacteraceae bacterium]